MTSIQLSWFRRMWFCNRLNTSKIYLTLYILCPIYSTDWQLIRRCICSCMPLRVPHQSHELAHWIYHLIAGSMGLTWGPSGADRTQVGPMLTPRTVLSGRHHENSGIIYLPVLRHVQHCQPFLLDDISTSILHSSEFPSAALDTELGSIPQSSS